MIATTLPTPSSTVKRYTIDDLMKFDGKAELIGGRIVPFMANGIQHNLIAGNVYVALRLHSKASRSGTAFTDNLAYRVPELLSGRESFSPDSSYYSGRVDRKDPLYVDGSPTFAVEVRSPSDYGPAAERDIAAKRDDYFEAGTLAVWDVDPTAETVTLYAAGTVTVFHRGEIAHAEPAVPGWSMRVDAVFESE